MIERRFSIANCYFGQSASTENHKIPPGIRQNFLQSDVEKIKGKIDSKQVQVNASNFEHEI